jgi:predicted metal-dependent hydrolase
MTESATRHVDLRGTTVEYTVRRSSRATKPRIDVDLRGVTVVVPDSRRVSPADLLRRKASWVIEKHREYERYREQVPERRHEAGETLPYLGEPHEVVVEQRSYSVVDDGALRLARHHVEDTSVKRALETLYRRNAREMFEALAVRYATAMSVEYERIEIRNQRTKWGSCSSSGTLSLNWRLLLAPEAIVEYLVVHEVAHLREPSHEPPFWNLVAEHDSQYEAHKEWLEDNSLQLIFSRDDL